MTIEAVKETKTINKEISNLIIEAIGQSDTSIVLTDLDGKIVFANQGFTKLSGYLNEEVIGKTPRVVHSGLTPSLIFEDMWNSISNGREWSGELINKHKAGQFYWVNLHVSPLRGLDSKVTHYLGIETDITQKTLIEQQLKKTTKDLQESNTKLSGLDNYKNELLGIVAHDLRNPLGRISLASELLLESNTSKEDTATLAEIINSTSTYMIDLLNEMLDFTKIETGKIDIKIAEVNLKAFSNTVLEENYFAAKKKDIELALVFLNDCGIALFDSKRIHQVLTNLLSNAIKFSKKQTKVELKVEVTKDHLIFIVSDQGPGLTEEDQGKLFKPFGTLSNKPTDKETSTGLGLAICKKLIDLHKGEIYVESEIGKGCDFIVKIPQL